ncbi:RimJ/RimL family protein N-acetyltransferase [Clostridium saccharoperbutylacetonicum]|uniref:GNAT family N-acetyltransferase n=1 Tax=Clostridium saccharoperbutylacetonicum TaxID=36745 RepID=UPI0003469619|nr:GNAT family N-acetyltransferase [Clostridium saccharoperbutylacetonicum]NRT64137.1 RimJ/RimL family protein N-acetyltransferase [Clostridium saccharoperbutylacetonicum]NSB27504.1 RimJ/RimL family protein N-acetyltransferase [Clostridium saccharoperbutylacetonicum]NSB40993.1 RimJ/RimL family protein N-acetyltransferase [Clostridium saccharoperbutylacetonicum]
MGNEIKGIKSISFWAIELKEISRAIGWFELCEATWKVEEEKFKYAKEIGFVLGEEYWGQGLMPEAIKLVLNYLFEEGIQVVMCSHFINNSQSEKVIKKCGFKFYREDDEEKYYYVNVGNRL